LEQNVIIVVFESDNGTDPGSTGEEKVLYLPYHVYQANSMMKLCEGKISLQNTEKREELSYKD
jgi:hypothetical protein